MYATSKNGHYHQQVEPTHQRSLLCRATMTATTTGLETHLRLEFQLFWNMTTMTTTIFTMMREARDIGGGRYRGRRGNGRGLDTRRVSS